MDPVVAEKKRVDRAPQELLVIDEFRPRQPCTACGVETHGRLVCPICMHAVTRSAFVERLILDHPLPKGKT